MKLSYVRNQDEFKKLNTEELHEHYKALNKLIPPFEQDFKFEGFSLAAGAVVDFQSDFLSGKYPNVNWRERVLCPITKLNNRMRYSVMILDMLGRVCADDDIYIMEQTTPLFNHLKGKYKNLIGSEFVSDQLQSGDKSENEILHQDATNLSFADNSFQAVLSFDVFEHVANFKQAFIESLRVLKVGGRLIFTAPFNTNSDEILIRAKILPNGEIEHLCEPEYHGDPMSNKGILSFQSFGWELIDLLHDIGFKDAYAVFGYSINLGFATPQMIIIAEK